VGQPLNFIIPCYRYDSKVFFCVKSACVLAFLFLSDKLSRTKDTGFWGGLRKTTDI